jgi:hypothetical protein
MIVSIVLTALRSYARNGQRIHADVVPDSIPKISRILWQVIPGHINVRRGLAWRGKTRLSERARSKIWLFPVSEDTGLTYTAQSCRMGPEVRHASRTINAVLCTIDHFLQPLPAGTGRPCPGPRRSLVHGPSMGEVFEMQAGV